MNFNIYYIRSFYSLFSLLLVTFVILLNPTIRAGQNPDYLFLSPVPNSTLIPRETTITIRAKDMINKSTISNSVIRVTGSKSGYHSGSLIQSDDKEVAVFKPDVIFTFGEKVTVSVFEGLKTQSNAVLSPITFSFTIKNNDTNNSLSPLSTGESTEVNLLKNNTNSYNFNNIPNYLKNSNRQNDTLPSNFPHITVTQRGNTAKGYIFLSNFPFNPNQQNTPYLMILDNSGYPVFYRRMTRPCFDFKMQNNNMLSYYMGGPNCFYVLDSTYNLVDSFKCGNGYSTDLHELRIFQNGHALIMSYDTETVNMSQIIDGGDPYARVAGLVVQELDQSKNVIFQWRSWDHYQITDATHENLTSHYIDYVHGNAVELDNDGNILVSCRHMDEITKINRQTGDIIWRMGGKNNQFQFINDAVGYSHQHAIRRITNGDLTLFDNGNYHSPPFSRACEYKVDEVHKTATLVWEYRNVPSEYGSAMGYVQKFENGNTVIGWGGANPTITEVDANGFNVFELNLPQGIYSYRAYRQEWKDSDLRTYNYITKNYNLQQNFPNPFNPASYIYYSLPQDGNVELDVFDITGRKVETLYNGFQTAGTYSYKFDGSNHASGVYFYLLRAGKFTEAKKMLLVK